MGTTDKWFWANGSSVNYSARGWGSAGFVARGRPPFTYGGAFHGGWYGVYGSTQMRPGEWPGWNEYSFRAGVRGDSPDATGAVGTSTSNSGVYGQTGELSTYPSGIRAGVFGAANNEFGVIGWSTVWGAIGGFSYSGLGIYGRSYIVSGIQGQSGTNQGPLLIDIPTTAGVVGTSAAVPGVIRTSSASFGVVGFSNNVGIFGRTTNPNSFAGFFIGNVAVNGTLSAFAKNSVVTFPDRTQRVLHCMESPEHWFEDFGTAKLRDGRATVKLDGDFAKVIKAADYHVFVTPEGDCGGLYVRSKRAASFEVRELNGGKSSIAFSYRIVGRRKDIKGHRRFAKFDARLPIPASPPRPIRKPPSATAARVRAFVAQVEKEASAPTPKRAKKKGGRSRELPKPLRIPLPV
jgi:hypothetical protein